MTPTFALTAQAAPHSPSVRATRTVAEKQLAAIIERAKIWVARAIRLPCVLPGQDGWYL